MTPLASMPAIVVCIGHRGPVRRPPPLSISMTFPVGNGAELRPPNLQTAAARRFAGKPEGLAIDPEGNLYAASNSDNRRDQNSATSLRHQPGQQPRRHHPGSGRSPAGGPRSACWASCGRTARSMSSTKPTNVQPHGRITQDRSAHPTRLRQWPQAWHSPMASRKIAAAIFYVTDLVPWHHLQACPRAAPKLTAWFTDPALFFAKPPTSRSEPMDPRLRQRTSVFYTWTMPATPPGPCASRSMRMAIPGKIQLFRRWRNESTNELHLKWPRGTLLLPTACSSTSRAISM